MVPGQTIVTLAAMVAVAVLPKPKYLVWDYPRQNIVFQVQQTDDLSDPYSWHEYAEVGPRLTNQIWVRLDLTNGQRFFRVWVPSGQ